MTSSRNLRRIAAAVVLFLGLAAAGLAAEKPALVVVISVDQMRADYLERFRPYFGQDGFNRFLERGAVFTQARYRHATTFTGPGHAAIGTGLDPRDSGIIANRWFDVNHNRPVYCAEDAAARWVGQPDKSDSGPILPASPVLMDGATIGDRLKETFPGARVVGLALKDRAAALMAGRKADAALWFEERFDRFVTSSFYPPQPKLLDFNAGLRRFAAPEHRRWLLSGRIPEEELSRITFDPPELYDAKNQPEDYKPNFPHELKSPKNVASSPWGDVLVLDLARHAIATLHLGQQASRPDLLFVGLSSTDYYGHWFGPDSREIADGIVRLDVALESFFHWLDSTVGGGKTLVFLTADHGVQPLPEVTRAKEKLKGNDNYLVAGRVDLSNPRGERPRFKQVTGDRYTLEYFLSRTFSYETDGEKPAGEEAAILFFDEPCLYLNRAALARRGLEVEKVKEAVRDWVRKRPGVETAYTGTEIGNGLPPTERLAAAITRSYRSDRSGDVFIVLKPGWMWSYGRDAGTTHGQPVEEDIHVPLLAWGAGVAAGSYDTPTSPLAIARTVGALFGFEVGEPDVLPLAPVLGAPQSATPEKKPAPARR